MIEARSAQAPVRPGLPPSQAEGSSVGWWRCLACLATYASTGRGGPRQGTWPRARMKRCCNSRVMARQTLPPGRSWTSLS